jgi:predicted signal transduction protein with EAL and GGDEF domain
VVARLGGDEFAIIHDGGRDTAAAVAERLIAVVGQPYRIAGHALSIGLSVGIALAPEHGADPDDLFKNADLALYGAKAEGRNTFRVFTQAMNELVRARQGLETDLRESFGRGDFQVHYQPVVSARTGEVVSFEALIRWHHPVRGWVSPGVFIPFAEEIGFILPLGEWVLCAACREAASWPSQARLAVNVSAIQVRHGRLVDTVIQALAASGLPARRLELEITETALMQDSAMVLETLHILRGLGVTIALDDFGTGYSSLSYLRIFPFDRIKIDRSFIATIHSPQTAEIVRAIVGLSVSLGMEITAEGVETEEQLEAVARQGCTEVQGFLFSPAVPADRIAGLGLRQARAA